MFGITKKNANAAQQKDLALYTINEAIREMETEAEANYCYGLITMAYTLAVIDTNTRSQLTCTVHEKQSKLKEKQEPVYKRKGLYTYKDYYIIKVEDNGGGAANWKVGTDTQAFISNALTFKDAVKFIDEKTKEE